MVVKHFKPCLCYCFVLLAQCGRRKYLVSKYRHVSSAFKVTGFQLQSDSLIPYSLLGQNFLKIHVFLSMRMSIFIGGQLESAVVSLTNGEYRGKYSLSRNFIVIFC